MSAHGYINHGNSRVPACNPSETNNSPILLACPVKRALPVRFLSFYRPPGCQRTDRSVITASSSSAAIPILHNGLRIVNMSAAESVSNVRSLVHSTHQIAVARSLRGKEAQVLIDFIDQVRGLSCSVMVLLCIGGTDHGTQAITLPELDEKLRKQCLYLLYKICKACEMLPTSYTLREEFIHVSNVRYCGGFADVSEGEYLGRRVAVKHLRFGTKDTFKIFKVPEP